MPLHVLSIAYPFAPVSRDPVGGAEQVLARLDRALVAAGHRSTVVAVAGSRTAGELVAIPAVAGPIDEVSRVRTYNAVRRAIAQTLEREAIDVVHIHGVDFAGYLPSPGVPVLVTLHLPPSLYPAAILQTSRPDTWLVPVSHTQARSFQGVRLLPPIENGVEIPPRTAHARRGFTLAMGRVCPEKNFADALDAAQLANSPLLLAGNVFNYSEHQAYFETQIAPRLDPRRRWIGAIAGTRKRRLLTAARCVLIPSRIAETSSLVAMESLAAGTPVVAYRSGALPEVVEHGRTGFIVDNVEQMAEAIRRIDAIDPTECRRVAEERYALDRMTRTYLDLYHRLIPSRHGASTKTWSRGREQQGSPHCDERVLP
jgi:glycosyltransferase involved in cell wall biosynthesis